MEAAATVCIDVSGTEDDVGTSEDVSAAGVLLTAGELASCVSASELSETEGSTVGSAAAPSEILKFLRVTFTEPCGSTHLFKRVCNSNLRGSFF